MFQTRPIDSSPVKWTKYFEVPYKIIFAEPVPPPWDSPFHSLGFILAIWRVLIFIIVLAYSCNLR